MKSLTFYKMRSKGFTKKDMAVFNSIKKTAIKEKQAKENLNKMSQENIQRLKNLAGKAAIMQMETDENTDNIDAALFEKTFGVFFPVKAIEKILEIYKKRLSEIIRGKMVDIMNEEGITSVTLDNGVKLELKPGLNPKVVDKEKEIAWIESIGMNDVVKTELKFPKGEVNEELNAFLVEKGYSFERADDVHFMTLRKIVKDRYEAGDGLPPNDAIAVETYSEVKIK